MKTTEFSLKVGHLIGKPFTITYRLSKKRSGATHALWDWIQCRARKRRVIKKNRCYFTIRVLRGLILQWNSWAEISSIVRRDRLELMESHSNYRWICSTFPPLASATNKSSSTSTPWFKPTSPSRSPSNSQGYAREQNSAVGPNPTTTLTQCTKTVYSAPGTKPTNLYGTREK